MCIQVGSTILLTKFLTCVAYGCKDHFRFRRFKDKECCFAGRNGITEPLHSTDSLITAFLLFACCKLQRTKGLVFRMKSKSTYKVPSSAADPEFFLKRREVRRQRVLRWKFRKNICLIHFINMYKHMIKQIHKL